MPERPDPAKVIPAPCPSCGEWRKSGMIHNCGSNPVNDPAKVIAEALRGWLPVSLADRARAQELAEAVLAALAAEGFPVGEPRDVGAIIERLAEKAWRDADVTTYPSRAGERPFHGRHMNVVRLSFAVAAVREAAQLDPDTDDFTVTGDELDRALDRAEKAEADAKRLFTALDGYIMARITGTDLRDYDDLAERAARAHRALATDVPGKLDRTVLDPETGIEEPVTTGRIPDAEFVEPPLMPPAASPDERLREAATDT